MTRYIQLPVADDVAEMYERVSDEDKRKVSLFLRILLKEVTQPEQTLTEIMDEIGANAAKRGLTPEILEELLRDE